MFTEASSPRASSRPATGSLASFLDELLAEQQQLQTPAARAGIAYDLHKAGPSLEKTHRDLIPLSAPRPGEQYAFEVDLDACSGCKACVSACHSLNGLDEAESWRDVGLVQGGTSCSPYQQTITSACHHCADPGCLNGCPVAAYEKDTLTGIVRHLDDQCIGCSYCILKCPYDVPKFNSRLGIVRKCDMCHQRLAVGEAPACAQACPTHAIRIVTVSTNRANESFLAAAPDPNYTKPTTRYISARPVPSNTVAADAGALIVQHAHAPLIAMLVLTQLGVGLLSTSPLHTAPAAPLDLRAIVTYYVTNHSAHTVPLLGVLLLFAGLGASVFHLGQPLRAWRFFLGLRTSWLSREILAFGFLAPLAAASLVLPDSLPFRLAFAFTGLAALVCSAMIYVDTRRGFWSPVPTFCRFFGTAVVASLIFLQPLAAFLLLSIKLGVELSQATGCGVSARVQRGPLRKLLVLRLVLAAAAAFLLLLDRPWPAFVLYAAGEAFERTLFFMAADAPRMPGHPATP